MPFGLVYLSEQLLGYFRFMAMDILQSVTVNDVFMVISYVWFIFLVNSHIYRVYKKKVDKSEIALYFAERLHVRCFVLK